MKAALLRFLRSTRLQPLWERLNHLSLVGMNYFASTIYDTGEIPAIRYAASRLGAVVVFDVGANTGQFAKLALATFESPRLFCFEPSTSARRLFTVPGATLLPYGLSDASGRGTLYSPGPASALASLHELRGPLVPFRPEHTESVEMRTLDEVCDELGITEIGFLKIDVEGHELAVLRGGQRMLTEGRIRFVLFEFSDANLDSRTYLRDFYDILAGYRLSRVVQDGLVPVPRYSPELERFACIYFLAERNASH